MPISASMGSILILSSSPCGDFTSMNMLDAVGDFVQRVDVERHAHAVLGAELVDQQLRAGIALDVLEQQRRAARAVTPRGPHLETRSVISAISRMGSASALMRISSPALSSAEIHSLRS